MRKFRKMLLPIVLLLLVIVMGLYAFAPHAPRTPKQVHGVSELEFYLNRLVGSSKPPGLSLVVVKDGNVVSATPSDTQMPPGIKADTDSLLTNTPPIDGHGLGWVIGQPQDACYLEHAGGGPGFATIMHLNPERGTGFAILANGTDLDRDGLMNLLAVIEW